MKLGQIEHRTYGGSDAAELTKDLHGKNQVTYFKRSVKVKSCLIQLMRYNFVKHVCTRNYNVLMFNVQTKNMIISAKLMRKTI